MQVVVTGADGFIGSALVRFFANRGAEVVGLSRTDSTPKLPNSIEFGAYPIDAASWEKLLKDCSPDWIFHAAGKASVPGSFEAVSEDFDSNTVEVFSILDSVRMHSPTSRFLLFSSAAVYGRGATQPISESTALAPVSPYGFHKRKAELICEEFAQIFGIKSVVLRVFSAYGEGLRKQVCWDLSKKLLAGGGVLSLQGTGEETRDFIHIEDLCRAVSSIIAHIERKTGGVEVFNVASGVEVEIKALAEHLSNSLGFQPEIEFEGALPPGVPVRWVADVSRLESVGFLPSISMEAGVSRYAEWVSNQLR